MATTVEIEAPDPRIARLVPPGEKLTETIRFSREDIIAFARLSFDTNPLHRDTQAAQRARFGEIIASGQHTAAILMGMLATHYSRRDDGVAREMLCLNMNFSFKGPVFADQEVLCLWRMTSATWNEKLGGVVAQLDGHVTVGHGRPLVVARGTILVKPADSSP